LGFFWWAKELFADKIHSSYGNKYFMKPTIHVWCKKMLGGQTFASDTQVQSDICDWLGQQPEFLFASITQNLVDR